MILKEKLYDVYRTLKRIRVFELRTMDLFKEQLAQGAAHTSVGEEAIAAGVCIELQKEDFITSTHRGHGHCIAKGISLKQMTAEILARVDGVSKGRGASMHIYSKEYGVLGSNGIVGGGIPIAIGAAYSCKRNYSGRVTVCFFGDGAANNGVFHESLNMASIWDLPVVFILENNLYAVATKISKSAKVPNLSIRAEGYGIPGETVDGIDVNAVNEAAARAIERARNGGGPTLIECKTFRRYGHTVADPQIYRDPEEYQDWEKTKCPIRRFENYLVSNKLMSKSEINTIDKEVLNEMDEAVDFAVNSPIPSLDLEVYVD